MTISDTIESMYENTENAYDKVQEKGGTIPANKNLQNLASAIDSISSSSFNPANLNELGEIVYDWFINKVQLEDKANYTQNAITIYTPSASCKTYVIRQRSDNLKYHIVWMPTGHGTRYYSNSLQICYSLRYANYLEGGIEVYNSFSQSNLRFSLQVLGSVVCYISTNAYDTIADAIIAIQNSSTAYNVNTTPVFSSISSGPLYSNCDYYVPTAILSFSSFDDFYKPTPISPNETIEVIQ